MNIAVVTGASAGMGREMVRQIDKIYTDGIDEIWIIARRVDRLKALSKEISHKARILPLDLTEDKDIEELELSLSLISPNIKLLVNASGYGIMGSFNSSNPDEQAGMVRLNCEAVVRVTRMCLDYMKKGARIIQFASAASFLPQPDFAVYAATKSFVLSFSRALREELVPRHISVTAVCPGPVDTEFFSIAEKLGSNFNFKKYFMADASKVVRTALVDAYNRKALSVYSAFMRGFRVLAKIFPHSLILFALRFMR